MEGRNGQHPGGYMGGILRVDLSSGALRVDTLPAGRRSRLISSSKSCRSESGPSIPRVVL